jgi:hypothetical protein
MKDTLSGLRAFIRRGDRRMSEDDKSHKEYYESVWEAPEGGTAGSNKVTEFVCPCPYCRNGFTNKVHGSAELIEEASRFHSAIDWDEFPKLATIFRNRPTVNIFWNELMALMHFYQGHTFEFLDNEKKG